MRSSAEVAHRARARRMSFTGSSTKKKEEKSYDEHSME